MTRLPAAVIAALMLGPALDAQTAKDGPELTRLLNEFLAGASRNEAAAHDRFWAEELVYTGSAGRRVGKADILRDVRSAPAPRPEDPKTTFGAEDVRIHQYGDTAVVAFRLVGTTDRGGKSEVAHYLNTGTFLRRHGKWQVVSWQATRMPRPEEESRKDVAAAEGAVHRAMLGADVKELEARLDEGFVWTHRDGEQMTEKKLLEELATGRLKYARLETSNVTVALHGDTAVVRGVSTRPRSSIPAGGADDAPFTTFYTLTFVNRSGAWKAVAMHTSRP